MTRLEYITCPVCAEPVPVSGLEIEAGPNYLIPVDSRISLIREALAKDCPQADLRRHSKVIAVPVADPDLVPLRGGPFNGFYRKRLGSSFTQIVGEFEHSYRLDPSGESLLYFEARPRTSRG